MKQKESVSVGVFDSELCVCVCVLGTAKSSVGRDMSCSFLIVARQQLNCNSGSDSDGATQDRQHKGQTRDVYALPLPLPIFSIAPPYWVPFVLWWHWRFHYFDFE